MEPIELIEQLHLANATERAKERLPKPYRHWWLAVPAAAAVALFVLLPLKSNATQAEKGGLKVYCNTDCRPEEIIDMVRQDIAAIHENI